MNAVMKIFNDMKINSKLLLGFSLVLSLLIAISALSYVTLLSSSDKFHDYAQRVRVVGIARDVDREFGAFQSLVREFAITGDAADADLALKKKSEVADLIKLGIAEIKNPDRLQKMQALQVQFAEFSTNFDKLGPLSRHQQQQIKEILDPNGVKLLIDTEILQTEAARAGDSNSIIHATSAMEYLMLGRLNMNKVLGRHDVALEKSADDAFEKFSRALKGMSATALSGKLAETLSETQVLANSYIQAYKAAAEDAHEIDRLVNTVMKAESIAIAELATAIKLSGVADETALEKAAFDEMVAAENMVLVLSIAGLLLGIGIAVFIGRSISIPVRTIAQVLMALANGNRSQDVPYADRGDEVGDNARAAGVFKMNMLRMDQLETEKTENERRLAAKRRQDFDALAGGFEAEIGSIINSVSTASSGLEVSARTLTKN
ncbi:MAG: hypothetical protein ACRCS9_11970, partial [Hyphomicrobium sp.]